MTDHAHNPPKNDLLTLGETMIRLSVGEGALLADCPALDIHNGGTESNVAVAVARLGNRARWLSRLTDNALGRRITYELSALGVDCSGVAWTHEDRVGTYFIEFGAPPRPTTVLYDRAHSAASKMTTSTFDLDQELTNTRILHLTGITPALSASCADLMTEIINLARAKDVHIVFDVNYRALLWPPETCAHTLAPLIEKVDTLLIGQADAGTVFGIRGTPQEVLQGAVDRFGVRQVGITLGEHGAIGLADGQIMDAPGYAVKIVDRIGAGDAFAAGVIAGLLESDFADFGLGLRYGVATSALQLTLHGDNFRLGRADVLRLLNSTPSGGATARPVR
jgi:2-dehydro-3-deoxygluconokinase